MLPVKKIFFLDLVLLMALATTFSHAEDGAPARRLINSQGCKACHSLEGDGGTLSVSFESMRSRLTRTEIKLKLVNQEHQHGNININDFSHLSDDEIGALITFIQPQPD